jgi:hypothetical protein
MGGRRTEANFRKTDAARAIESAKAAGLEPSMVEVVLGADGSTTFRVYGDKAGVTATPDASGAKQWAAEIERLKTATPRGGGK